MRHSPFLALLFFLLLFGCVEHARKFVEITTGGAPPNVTNITNVTPECPPLPPVSPLIVESCLDKGGEMVSELDERGCPLPPRCVIPEKPPEEVNISLCGGPEGITCPEGMRCDINMMDPLLFGVCVPIEEVGPVCGGPEDIPCPEGYECVEGVCVLIEEELEVTDFCWGTYGESSEKVISINDCGNNMYRLGREGFGSEYAYITDDGRLIAECGGLPEEKCNELDRECTQVDNICLLSPGFGLHKCPENLTRIDVSTCDVYSPVCGMFFSFNENKTTLSWKEYPNSCYACYDRSAFGGTIGYRDGICDRTILFHCPSIEGECPSKEKVCAMIKEDEAIKWKEFDSHCDACAYFANKVTDRVLNITNKTIVLERRITNASAPATILGFREGECAGGGTITECIPVFEAIEDIRWYAPVCARIRIGNETSYSLEWRTRLNMFSACAFNESGLLVLGYRLGEC